MKNEDEEYEIKYGILVVACFLLVSIIVLGVALFYVCTHWGCVGGP